MTRATWRRVFQSPQVGDRSCKLILGDGVGRRGSFNPLKSGTGPASHRLPRSAGRLHQVSIPSSRGQVLQVLHARLRVADGQVSIPSSRGQVLQARRVSTSPSCPARFNPLKSGTGPASDRRVRNLRPPSRVSIPSSRGQVLQGDMCSAIMGWLKKFQSPQVGDRSCKWDSKSRVFKIGFEFQSPQVGDRSCKAAQRRQRILDIAQFQSPQVGDRSCKT